MIEEIYLENANKAKAVALLINIVKKEHPKNLMEIVNNKRVGQEYVHFAVIDPKNSSMIYERPDIEEKPLHTHWENIFEDLEEFKGMQKELVFFDI